MSIRNKSGTFNNNKNLYSEYFRERNVKFIKQYESPTLNYPTSEDIADLTLIKHVWTTGDRFYKLALTHYGNMSNWWVIPWFNQKPLESDYNYGDIVYIPLPIEEVLALT